MNWSKTIFDILRKNYWFILLALLLIIFFLVNFGFGRFYSFTDISNIELHPWQEFLKRFSMWQQTRGFGLEMGTEAGYAVPLIFFTALSNIGFSALQINFTINLLLFILPGLSISILAYAIFYRYPRRNLLAFFAGLLAGTSFVMYIRGLSPLFLEVWPWISAALITATLLLILQNGKKRYWFSFLIMCFLNIGTFTGVPFGVAPFIFGGSYVIYYLLIESPDRRKDFLKILFAFLILVLISLPMIWAVGHSVFSDSFQAATSAKSYTWSVFNLNLNNIDFSGLTYGFRLIGTCNWNAVIIMPGFVGLLAYPYYTLFTYNPLFVLSSFMLPIAAFGSLLFKESKQLKKRLLFLAVISILFLFFMKGIRDPFGDVFLWLMTHVSQFSMFRTPYDKIAPALAYSLCIAAAYTFSRVIPSLRQISVKSFSISRVQFNKKISKVEFRKIYKKPIIKNIIAIALLTALILNAYPAYTGQLLYRPGFFNIPPYYQQVADYVKSDPASFKILGLPSVEYTNRYSWGYFGITFDGVNLNKPVLERSYTGSDLYGDRIISALQDEVLFRSDLPSAPVGGKPIFADNTTPNASINLDRVKYYGYLLEKSNVGQMFLRNDMAGGYAYQINANDWQRYNTLFQTLDDLGVIGNPTTFGNVTIYDVNNYLPLIYANSPSNVYGINDYSTILTSNFVDPQMDILASLNNYNPSIDYIANGASLGNKDVYVLLTVNQYSTVLQNQLILESQYTAAPDITRITEINSTLQQLQKIMIDDYGTIAYIDNIRNSGSFNVIVRLSEGEVVAQSASDLTKILNSQSYKIEFGNQSVALKSFKPVGNNWFDIGSVNLTSGNLVARSSLPQQVKLNFPTGKTEVDMPSEIVIQDIPIRHNSFGGWQVELGFANYTYSNLRQLLSDGNLDSTFRANIAKALGVSVTTSQLEIALISSNQTVNNVAMPSITFQQIQPGKLVISVQNATNSFFLNFLESYQKDWNLYMESSTLDNSAAIRTYEGSSELPSVNTPLALLYDLQVLQNTPVLDDKHYLLNGNANSWYIDLNELDNQHLIIQNADGSYSFNLLLYYSPENIFSITICVSIVTGVVTSLLICLVAFRSWKRKKTNYKNKSNYSNHLCHVC